MNKFILYIENLSKNILSYILTSDNNIITELEFINETDVSSNELKRLKEIVNIIKKTNKLDLTFLQSKNLISMLQIPVMKALAEKININEEIKKLKQAIDKYSFYKSFTDIQRKLSTALEDNEEFNIDLTKVSEDLLKLTKDDFLSLYEITKNLLEKREGKIKFYPSYFNTLNKKFNNCVYRSGDLHVIAARPAVGKTMFLLNEATTLAMHEHKVAFFTLEMPAEQCTRRILSRLTYTEYKNTYNNYVLKEKIKDVQDFINQLNLKFFEAYSVDYIELANRIRLIAAQGFDVIFIDQLSHIKHDERAYSKHSAIEKTIRLLRTLALQLNVCIIIACQINRQGAQNEEPDLENLKESGSIEEASQLVIMLHKLKKEENKLKIMIKKATHGICFDFTVNIDYAFCKFVEV